MTKHPNYQEMHDRLRVSGATVYSTVHPHEPGIPPALDEEGRCLVCLLLVGNDTLTQKLNAIFHLANDGGFSAEFRISEIQKIVDGNR